MFLKFNLSNDTHVGWKLFVRVQRELHILKDKHRQVDLFSCTKCLELDHLNEALDYADDEPSIIQLQTKILKIELHQEKAKLQWNSYHYIGQS